MFQELKSDYPSFKPPANGLGLLTPWADQGILLLNTCLTVQAHEANSHKDKGWEPFTQKVIDTVVKVRSRGVVFIAWGTPAQKRCAKITGGKHLVLKGVHPSPLAAHKGFFGCGHFRKTNDWLEERYGKEGIIDWNLDVQKPIKAAGSTNEPVKVAASQAKSVEKSGPTTELPVVKNGKPAVTKKDFDDEDDADAIEALEELVRSDAIEAPQEDDQKENQLTPRKEADKVNEEKVDSLDEK